MANILLLDGYNLAFRSYYAVPELSRSDGMPTNAIHGWVRTLWKLQDTYSPAAMYVFFDLGGSTRRLGMLPEYKAQRTEAPESFRIQVPEMKHLAESLGMPLIEREGIEADDMIAAAALKIAARGQHAYMVSADKDLAQVIRPGITQLLPPPTANPRLGWRELDAEAVMGKFGVSPELIVDYLTLIGDTSDNIPGLAGVGPKTAVKWLNEYGSLDGILKKRLYVKPARFQVLLDKEAERLKLHREIIRLETDLEVDLPATAQADRERLFAQLEALEMARHLTEARKRYA